MQYQGGVHQVPQLSSQANLSSGERHPRVQESLEEEETITPTRSPLTCIREEFNKSPSSPARPSSTGERHPRVQESLEAEEPPNTVKPSISSQS